MQKCNSVTSAAAGLEWAVSFILTFHFLTIILDLWPAGKSSPRYMRRLARWQERHGQGDDFTGRGAFQEFPERWQGRADDMQQASWNRNAGTARNSEASGAPMMANTGR